jgi:alkylation response protein AidB-like acyl-CoA dehydrogenase
MTDDVQDVPVPRSTGFVRARCAVLRGARWPQRRRRRRLRASSPGVLRRVAGSRPHPAHPEARRVGADALATVIVIRGDRGCAASSLVPRSTSSAPCRCCWPAPRLAALPDAGGRRGMFSYCLSGPGGQRRRRHATRGERVGDDFILGAKRWITNAGCQVHTVFARHHTGRGPASGVRGRKATRGELAPLSASSASRARRP